MVRIYTLPNMVILIMIHNIIMQISFIHHNAFHNLKEKENEYYDKEHKNTDKEKIKEDLKNFLIVKMNHGLKEKIKNIF